MKLLYLNHNPWNWILQRSQILALEMEKYFQCDVVDKKYFPFMQTAGQNKLPKKIINIPQLRGGGRLKVIDSLNRLIYKVLVRRLAKKYDAMWICYPTFVECIPKDYKGLIIYDCMDNHVELAKENQREEVRFAERRLLERADIKIASANHLIRNVEGLEDALLVRNGFISEEECDVKKAEKKEVYKIGYFGAIERWFDFALLLGSVEAFNDLEYHLIGPIKSSVSGIEKVTENSKFVLEGVVPHVELKKAVVDYDALIMPFVVNDIVLSVDPVKLYEYIYFGKCVISIWYPEIDRFSPYVYFYKNKEEYYELLDYLRENGFKPKYTKEQGSSFLKDNSWEARGMQIKDWIKAWDN